MTVLCVLCVLCVVVSFLVFGTSKQSLNPHTHDLPQVYAKNSVGSLRVFCLCGRMFQEPLFCFFFGSPVLFVLPYPFTVSFPCVFCPYNYTALSVFIRVFLLLLVLWALAFGFH